MKKDTPKTIMKIQAIIFYGFAIFFIFVWIGIAVSTGAPIIFSLFGVGSLALIITQAIVSLTVLKKTGKYIDRATEVGMKKVEELLDKLDENDGEDTEEPPQEPVYRRKKADYDDLPPEKDPWDL